MRKVESGKFRVGIDIGGTFTDIIFIGGGTIISKKILSTPDDFSRAILEGISSVLRDNTLSSSSINEVVHGSTIVTNACIELKGAKVGLITTRGFRDVLEITRGRMPVMYDITWKKPPPLAPRDLRFEINERINAKGEIIQPLDIDEVREVIKKLVAKGVEGVAVCLLNSPKNPIHEQKIGQLLKKMAPELYFSLSTEVMPLIKEYERTSETAVNTYVMPLVSTYLQSLRRRLIEAGVKAPLYIMQSSGGMITPEIAAQRPIEIIECGPAAGVVGSAFLAQQQNIGNIITLDMGGTTAKAAIIEDGQFTRSPEYEVGGGIHRASRLMKGKGYVVRIPSIDIAEIGAGGGSIIRVDVGGALHIGPESAGAVPGPACYDLDGTEATLTDANVILGYINQDYLVGGELKIDSKKAFKAIKEKIAKPLGKSVIEAAYGAHLIANSNMMRAIRAVSSERGRDPRRYILYAFGGAGPCHAAGIARSLGMKTVIVPPVPGVCSAFGLLCSDIERHYAKAFSYVWDEPEWDDQALKDLNLVLDKVTSEAESSVEVWAGRKGKPVINRYLDIRYQGQANELTIPVPERKLGQAEMAKVAEDFKEEYYRTYGYRLNIPMAVVTIRLVARIVAERPTRSIAAVISKAKAAKTKKAPGMRKAYWGEKYGFVDTPVLELEQIGEKTLKGPLLIDRYDTTIVIPPGCTATLGDSGNVVINIKDDIEAGLVTAYKNKKVDMVTLEIINNFLYSLVDEMTQAVCRTSLSPITREAFDFQNGICNAKGEILLEGEGITQHSMVYPTLIQNWMKAHGDSTYPGDIIMTNDPYSDAAHLPDVYMYKPIFLNGEIIAWAIGGGHQRDIGGAVPGSCPTNTTEIFQEGLRIPPMKLYERGVGNKTLYTIIRAASRAPDIVEADIEAYKASLNLAEKRLMELVDTYGWKTLKLYLDELLDYTERLTRAAIKELPDGDYDFVDYLDDGGQGFFDEEGNIINPPVKMKVTIRIRGDSIIYDFTGTDPQVKGAMNNPFATSKGTTMANLRLILNPDIPRNGGAVRAVKLVIPPGTLLNPILPAAVASRGATLGRQADLMQGAEAKIAPDKMMACPSGIDTLINFGGYDENSKPFICMETIWGGWGGRPFADGVDYCTIPHQNISNQPCEVNEELYPIMFNQYAYIPDREGAGKFRGSVAMVREWKLLVNDVIMSLRVDRQRFGAYGLYGGEPGGFLEVFLNPNKEKRHLGKTTMILKKGDVIRLYIAGAGGWGNPLERDVNAVIEDVALEKITIKRAREVYGVVISEDTLKVKMDETKKLREVLQKERDAEQRDKEVFRMYEVVGHRKYRTLTEKVE